MHISRARSLLMERGLVSKSSQQSGCHRGETGCNSFGINMFVTALVDQSLAHLHHFFAVRHVAHGADFSVGRPGFALAPESKPDSKLVSVTNRAFEIDRHQGSQLVRRRTTCTGQRLFPGDTIFIGDISERLHQQAVFALEMQVDDALAQACLPATVAIVVSDKPFLATERMVAWISCSCRSSFGCGSFPACVFKSRLCPC